MTWQKLDAATFCDLVTEFLSLHPNLEPGSGEKDAANSESKNGSAVAKRRKSETSSILDADEDDQIAAAIAASLKQSSTNTASNNSSDTDDDDDLLESFSAENSNSAPLPSLTSNPVKSKYFIAVFLIYIF